ncbi:Arc-like DNA binding dprotein [Roseateles toxinivorans]|uniref:Arc-like DNA binding dprotein n=1 Tax=Roseateles toxinivorans TaxID=270368 RepID=A0A4R6QFY4_9BURK|nr:Arc-like DNA binding dprotein [Roseateles toxinivorans]
MVPLWMESAVPTTLTLKNIPDAVYDRLKLAAEMHRRSLNSEAIVCLESVLLPTKMMPSERIARARELRAALPDGKFRARDIDAAKREGRP